MGGCISSYENGDDDVFPATSLYKKREWQETNKKEVIKQINSGKIAKVEQGRVNKKQYFECPICFLYYKEINLTKCCNHEICSECYLQLCPKLTKTRIPCPYCKRENFSVTPCKKVITAEPPAHYHHRIKKYKQRP